MAGNQRFCGEECREASYEGSSRIVESAILAAEGLDQDPPGFRRCATCGKLFRLKYKNSRALYCSDECRETAAKLRYQARKYRRRMARPTKPEKQPAPPPREKDGITWDEIRAVLKEFGISSYEKALQIAKQRKEEAE